jgi:anti-sigma factor RsiW
MVEGHIRMKEDIHERAIQLIDRMQVEGLSAEERDWLEAHLEGCPQCQKQALETERALRALRSAVPRFDVALVLTARMQAQIRARELIENTARMQALWISCALSWVLGVVSAPLLWRGFEWLGHRLEISRAVWITGFALSWVAPAVVVGAVIAWRYARGSSVTEQQ